MTDGYGNSRVHRYTAEGKHVVSWGAPGVDPGEFQVPHNVVIDQDENVYVTDRENYRLQVFDSNGDLRRTSGRTSTDLRRCAWTVRASSTSARCSWTPSSPTIRRSVIASTPTTAPASASPASATRLRSAMGPRRFIAPHGFGVDSQGNLYVGEVSYTVYGRRLDPPQTFRCFRKLERKGSGHSGVSGMRLGV